MNNMEKMEAAIAQRLKEKNTPKANTAGLKFAKFELGDYEIRFLPYDNGSGEPFQQMETYELNGVKLISPSFFGLEDPIKEAYNRLRKEQDNWNKVAKFMRPKQRAYCVILVRNRPGENNEEKGPQVWEVATDFRDTKVYPLFIHKNNKKFGIQPLDPEHGMDFSLSVTPKMQDGKPRMWNGKPVKDYSIIASMDKTPLSSDPEMTSKFLKGIPDIGAYFKKFLKSTEELQLIVDEFVASKMNDPMDADEAIGSTSRNTKDKPATSRAASKLEDTLGEIEAL